MEFSFFLCYKICLPDSNNLNLGAENMITNTLNTKKAIIFRLSLNFLSGKRGSNSRPQPWQGCALPTELFPQMWKFVFWAENEARTRDPNLGKVVLYQLSYFRKCEEEETRTPTSQLTLPPQSSASTNSATSPFEIKNSLAGCPEQDSNLHVVKHSHLKRARLPFRHLGFREIIDWAENEARTRDPNLGKVVLYQLSYFRSHFLNCGAKLQFNFELARVSAQSSQKKFCILT